MVEPCGQYVHIKQIMLCLDELNCTFEVLYNFLFTYLRTTIAESGILQRLYEVPICIIYACPLYCVQTQSQCFKLCIIYPGSLPDEDIEEEEEEFGGDGGQSAGQSRSDFSGREMVSKFRVGTRVVRGPDWKWGDQVWESDSVNAIQFTCNTHSSCPSSCPSMQLL